MSTTPTAQTQTAPAAPQTAAELRAAARAARREADAWTVIAQASAALGLPGAQSVAPARAATAEQATARYRVALAAAYGRTLDVPVQLAA